MVFLDRNPASREHDTETTCFLYGVLASQLCVPETTTGFIDGDHASQLCMTETTGLLDKTLLLSNI
jgi:hypothetical protein